MGALVIVHSSLAHAEDAGVKNSVAPEKSPEDVLNVNIALPEKSIETITFKEANDIWGPIAEQLHSNNEGKRKAALKLMSLSFHAALERTRKYLMMGETLVAWARMCRGRQNDVLRCAVNDVIMSLDYDGSNIDSVGMALGGLLDLDLPHYPNDNRSTLMMRWQGTAVFRELIAPPPKSAVEKQDKL